MNTNTIERIASMTYGVEIEYTSARREKIAKAVAEAVGGTAWYDGRHLANWVVKMPDGRKWQVESDASVTGSGSGNGGEVVTPVLTYADMPMLQKVVRAMRAAGAEVNNSCGSHIHVGAKQMTAKQLRNLVVAFYRQEELILKAAGVRAERLGWYTRRQSGDFVGKVAAMRSPTKDAIGRAYYGGHIPENTRFNHYHDARYRTLNLHNLWNGTKGTVEFRFFEGTLHAGEIRANVLLALTLVAYAMDARAVAWNGARRAYSPASGKYDLRVLLLRLGWIGEEFKAPRAHMMKRVGGSAAWKDGAAHGRRVA